MSYIACRQSTNRWWRLDHEADYEDGDLLFKVEQISTHVWRVTEIPNESGAR